MNKNKFCPNCDLDYDELTNFCLGCGEALISKDKIINCTFEYQCPLDWNKLQKSEHSDIRFCTNCEKNVYFAHSQNEVDKLAAEGKCVAFNYNSVEQQDEFPPLMGIIVPPENYPDFEPSVESPVSANNEKEKKSWWNFWK